MERLAARFATDLTPLFADLPDPRPVPGALVQAPWTAPPVSPQTEDRLRWAGIVRGSIWPIAIVAGLLTKELFLFILIALVVSTVLQGYMSKHRQPPPELEQ